MNKIAKQSPDLLQELIQKLKELYPTLFNDEKNMNEEELRNLMSNFASRTEGKYEFNWAGKMNAKRIAFTPSRAMLKPDKKRSIDFDKTENLIIEGDNLEVLKLLQKSYSNSIKCIYIDPPYNTGKDFVYSDDFSESKKAYWESNGTVEDGVKIDSNTESQGRYHSNWLNMMYSRLLLSRRILSDSGLLFVSIGEQEVHNLRKILDDIYGEENFIGQIIVISNPRGSQEPYGISATHEYLLVYSKEPKAVESIIGIRRSEEDEEFNYTTDTGEKARLLGLRKRGGDWRMEDRPNMYYPFYVDKNTGKVSLEKNESFDFEVFPIRPDGEKSRWTWGKIKSKEKIHFLVGKEIIRNSTKTYDIYRIDKLTGEDGEQKAQKLKSIFDDKEMNYQSARQHIKELLGNSELFDFPKPPELLGKLLKAIYGNNYIVLDFFAGSGTTAQSVLEMNVEDGGNRKFILVQLPEQTKEESEAYKAGYKTISQICIERVKRVSEKMKKEKVEGVDLGFKVFTLTKSLFPENQFLSDPEKTQEDNKLAFEKYLQNVNKQLDFSYEETELMYEVLLKDGFKLNFTATKDKEFDKNTIYQVSDGEKSALLCIDGTLHEDTLQKLQKHTDTRLLCLERAVDTTKKWNLKNMFGDNLWVI